MKNNFLLFFMSMWYNFCLERCYAFQQFEGDGMQKEFSLGDHVILRKPHACGGSEWEIIRVGADIKLKCVRCGRIVMLDRADFIRSMKTRLSPREDL